MSKRACLLGQKYLESRKNSVSGPENSRGSAAQKTLRNSFDFELFGHPSVAIDTRDV